MKALKALKYTAFILGGLLAIVVALGVFLAATLDMAKLKAELAQVVWDKKQRTLKIEGDVALSFWPSLGMKLGRTTLSERNSEELFAALNKAHISVAIFPLLKKQVVIDTITLSGVNAAIVRHKDGSTNIDDLLEKDKDDSQMLRFDITAIKLDHANLTYRDEKSGLSIALAELSVNTGKLSNAAEGKLELAGKLTGEQPRNNADIKLTGRYRYDLDEKRYGVSGLDAKVAGEVYGLKGLDLQVSVAALDTQPGKSELSVAGLEIASKGKLGEDSFDIKLDARKLGLTAERASGDAINIVLKLKGAARNADVRMSLTGIDGTSQALQAAGISLVVDAKQGDMALKGALQSPMQLDLTALTLDLSSLNGEFDFTHPRMPMKSVKLPIVAKLHADLTKQTAAGSLATQFDESKVDAKINVSRFTPLALAFDVDIDKLNVDKYLPPGGGKTAAGNGTGTGKGTGTGAKPATPEQPIDLSALKALNASGSLRIGQLQVANVKASKVRLDIKAADGKLDVAPLSANLYEGSLSGALSVNATGNRLAVKQTLSGISINPLMKDALNKDLLEGRGNVALDVTAGGATISAMKKALAGNASLSLKDGAIKGINLAQKFREAKALLSGKQDAVQQAKQTDKTDFSELSASFRIANGVAHNQDLAMKAPFLRLAGAGDLDIGEGRMNYLARASVVNTSAGQAGKDLDYLKGLTVPVRVTGPFEALSYKLEFAGLVTEAVKAKVEEKVKETVKETAQEKLKGLFGH